MTGCMTGVRCMAGVRCLTGVLHARCALYDRCALYGRCTPDATESIARVDPFTFESRVHADVLVGSISRAASSRAFAASLCPCARRISPIFLRSDEVVCVRA